MAHALSSCRHVSSARDAIGSPTFKSVEFPKVETDLRWCDFILSYIRKGSFFLYEPQYVESREENEVVVQIATGVSNVQSVTSTSNKTQRLSLTLQGS
jgi:hypothetical protein